ncbi:MAG: prepilin-type N-terminal cleavage/methylation domain-containing protein [Myxococcota bacterium]|jgi:prepilin-type N-terminal cleavage/methylation domain-containing protein
MGRGDILGVWRHDRLEQKLQKNPTGLYVMRRAFTLIEVIITVAILGIVTAIGWSSMQAQIPRFRMVRAARSLRADLMEIRSLAVQTNRESRLRLTSAGGDCSDGLSWGGAWELSVGDQSAGSEAWDLLPADAAEDGSDDDQSQALVDLGGDSARAERWVCMEQWAGITGPGFGNADAIVFSPRGWVTNPPEDFNDSGYIEITFVNQDANRKGVSDEVTVMISRSGMVRLVSALGSEYITHSVGTATGSSAP